MAVVLTIMSDLHQSSKTSWRFDSITQDHKFETVKVYEEKLLRKLKPQSTVRITGYSVIDEDIILNSSTKVSLLYLIEVHYHPNKIMPQVPELSEMSITNG